jgi:NTP pyrophosphatase (non-canonical NTP hydrolase)
MEGAVNTKDYAAKCLELESTPEVVAYRGKKPVETTMLGTLSLDVGEPLPGRLLHAALGCGTEAGELLDIAKKALVQGKPVDRLHVIEEAGDLLWYVVLALDAVGSNLDEAMAGNVAKLDERYRGFYAHSKSLVRNKDAERAALEEAVSK